MLFKLFQLFLRWFPMLHRFVQKRRSKNSIMYRHVFNKAFCTVSQNPETHGSIHNPLMVNDTWESYFEGILPNLSSPKYECVYSVVKWKRESRVLLNLDQAGGHRLENSDALVNQMIGSIGKVFRFNSHKHNMLLFGVSVFQGAIIPNKMLLTFLELPEGDKSLFDLEVPTIQWEMGAIRKKDLPITHMLREKDAVRLAKRFTKEGLKKVKK